MAEHHQPQHLQFRPHRQQPPAASTQKLGDLFSERGPSTAQVLMVVTLVPLGVVLLQLAGLAFVGTIIGLIVAARSSSSSARSSSLQRSRLAIAGFLTSGAFGIAGLAFFTWLLRSMMELPPEPVAQVKRKMRGKGGPFGPEDQRLGPDHPGQGPRPVKM